MRILPIRQAANWGCLSATFRKFVPVLINNSSLSPHDTESAQVKHFQVG